MISAGWGEGEQVADGRWLHARELPARARAGAARARRDRSAALRPQERLAALLGGRSTALLCEELTLRARLDLDQGRLAPRRDRAGARARGGAGGAARRGAPGPRAARSPSSSSCARASPRRPRRRARRGGRARRRGRRGRLEALDEELLRARARAPGGGAARAHRAPGSSAADEHGPDDAPRSAPGAAGASCTSASRSTTSACSRCCAPATASTR